MGGPSDPAYVESMPIPTINKAMASVDAAVAKTFATAVRLNIGVLRLKVLCNTLTLRRRATEDTAHRDFQMSASGCVTDIAKAR